MKYLIIGVITLFITLLVSRVFMALNSDNYNMYNTKSTQKSHVKSTAKLEKTGKSIYLVYCSSCHGYDGKGNNDKAQNHTKRMAKKSVLDVIKNGSNNFTSLYPLGMPAGLISGDDAQKVADFVANGMRGERPKAWSKCVTCHDESGEGIAQIAPNIKTYSDELVETVLKNGKKGVIGIMPSFKGRLSDVQMKSLATYIRSIAVK